MSRRELEEFLSSLTRAEIDDKLSKLTISQAKVLYEKFDDKSNPLIGDLLGGKSVGWVEGETRNAYKKLGIDTKQVHSSEISSILNTYFRESFMEWIDDDYENIDIRFPEEELEEETAFDSEPDGDENEEIKAKDNDIKADKADAQATAPPPRPRRWTVPLLIVGILLIAIVAFLIGRFFPVRVAEFTSSPSPTDQQVQMTDTMVPKPTNTELVSQPIVPTLTVTALPPTPTSPPPTETPTMTNTPLPTETPTPAVEPLFFDDFTDGKSDMWKTVYGDPIIVNNALSFQATTLMVIDANDWTDYEVSFDVSNIQCQGAVSSRGVTIGQRYQNANNMMALRIFHWSDYCDASWYLIKDGDWNKMPNASFPLPPKDSNGVRHFILSVKGNTYNSPFGVPLVIEDFQTGGVSLMANKGVIIDNFRVIPLDSQE